MTNPAPHGQVPAIQRYKIGYHSDEWGVRSSTPDGIKDRAGSWVLYKDHIAALRAAHVQKPAEIEHVTCDVSKNGAESNMSTRPVAQQGAAYAALPEPLEIDWPELHSQALGCGVEDRGLHNRYECAEYGWQDGVDKCAERVPEQIFDADQMRAFADATHTLRAESLAAAYREELDKLSQRNYELRLASQQPAPAEVVYSTPEEMFGAILTPQTAPATQQAGGDLAELSLLNRLIELGNKAAGAHATSNSDDGPKGTAAYVQWQELRAEMGELARKFYSAAPQPSPTAQAASSAVLKAIREANMQLVRTGDSAFMLVPYKVTTTQAAESVTAPAGPTDAQIDACARSMLYQPWGIGSRIEDARAFAKRILSKFAPPAHAAESVLEDAAQESEYRRGYRHGYEQRDAEVRGALA